MASEPKSNGAHSYKIHWPAAKAYWLALPDDRRTYETVAQRFQVSAERVGQVARRDGWREELAALQADEDAEVRRVFRRNARNRAERLGRTLEFYDRANDLALAEIPLDENGEVDLARLGEAKPKVEALLSSMPGLFKMAELAAGEATDRVAIAEVQPVLVAFARIAVLRSSPEERGEVIRELEAASAGLVQIGPADVVPA
jgi:hypothetical protein